ncbi:hypothetical protein B0T17DRAFT_482181 [Bombardia bombarda]|uniref:FAD-binding FR-type domain-containing protein n=1 Tax=Bombardia bombarda TaxID=252184 RepID=A0AA40CDV7_9PEZI|nr:hypothetical protein B0T17DRAFT_482181 [Bombardia bombarda]
MTKEGHLERTANEPRDPSLHGVIIKYIDEINPTVRVFRLEIPDGGTIKFLPGQWLDVHVPTVPKAGGFTITSPPSKAIPSSSSSSPSSPLRTHPYPYIELAIQKSPDNPPAAWLWQHPTSTILNSTLDVRVGGSFVWPPPLSLSPLRKAVFVAGGVGINPLMSMLSAVAEDQQQLSGVIPNLDVQVLYSVKDPGPQLQQNPSSVLFLDRIASLFARGLLKGELKLFLTRGDGTSSTDGVALAAGDEADVVSCCSGDYNVLLLRERISVSDVEAALGQDKQSAVVYVCGVPTMTDHLVNVLTSTEGLAMEADRVLYERWW